MNIHRKYYNELPVSAIAAEVNESLRRNGRIVVTAPPGSGKSTLLPLTVLQEMPEGRIVMLEPRRAAARQIAMRMAFMLGETAGATVGYRMRFESRVSEATRIEVVTEGVMERMLIDDPALDGINTVIFDEFHERSLAADLTLALTLEAQRALRPDLRVIVMSATMDTESLCKALDAPLIEAEGKMHNISIIYGEDADLHNCAPAVVAAVRRAWREQSGNILAFLPGQAEIARCMEALCESLPDAVVLPLHGMLPPAEQYRAIEYNPDGQRKIVLATPIAETSLTIGGITAVVDSGLYRAVHYDPSTALSRLVTGRISLDMARQRTGRAGRLQDGVCYRLWSKATENRMNANRAPEISEADLSGMLLDIAAWGCGSADELPWITLPPRGHVTEGLDLLERLGAIDSRGIITPHGRKMASLPSHPRVANMLIRAASGHERSLATDIAAILEDKDPVGNENDADINTRISLLRRLRSAGKPGRLGRIISIAAQYRRMMRCSEDNTPFDPCVTGKLIASAYPERIAMRAADNIYRLSGGGEVRINDADDLAGCEFLAIASVGKRIFLASPVDRSDLEEIAVSYDNITWNSREGRLITRKGSRIGALTIGSQPLESPDRDAMARELGRAVQKEGLSMLDFNDNVGRLQRRIMMAGEWHPELELPDVSTEALLASAPQWLPAYAGGATTVAELRKIDLREVIRSITGYTLMHEIDVIAPETLRLPSGRNALIDYRSGSPLPVVSARLQECLGMYDTPRIDGGRRQVVMELLSPGYKPVQLTSDLRGFWTSTYFEVRKELRRRYPKHLWPDNPLEFTEADRQRPKSRR